MNDNEYRGMVLQHDKHLDTLTSSITVLADNVGTTNRKLDDVIDVINTQNVLVERMNNLDSNLKESFLRVHRKIQVIEEAQNGEGCSALKIQDQKISGLGRSVDGIRDRLEVSEKELLNMVSGTVIRWGIGIILVYVIAFGAYTVQTMHTIDSALIKEVQLQAGNSKSIGDALNRHESTLDKFRIKHENLSKHAKKKKH